MSEVFFVSSPHHAFLASTLAEEHSRPSSVLYCLPVFEHVDPLIKVLREEKDSPFSDVIELQVANKGLGTVGRRVCVKNNRSLIKNSMKRIRPAEVYIFNDFYPEAQQILVEGETFGSKCNYVEDGVAAYTEVRAAPLSAFRLIKDKILYGRHYMQRPFLGAHPSFGAAVVLYPEFVRKELRSLEIRGISQKDFKRIGKKIWFKSYAKSLGVSPDVLKDYDGVFLLPSGKNYNRASLIDLIMRLEKSELNFAYKYHAKRWVGPKIDVISDKELPAGIPMELIYLRAKNRLRFLLGANSTALLTAKFLDVSENIVSLSPILGFTNPTLRAMFQALGMEPTKDLDGLAAILAS